MKFLAISLCFISTSLFAQSSFETSLQEIETAEKNYSKACVEQNTLLRNAYKETPKPIADYTYEVLLNENEANDLMSKIKPDAYAHYKFYNDRYSLLEKNCDELNVSLARKSLENESLCDTNSVETIFFHSMLLAAKEKKWSKPTVDKLAAAIRDYSEKMLNTDYFNEVNYLSAHNLILQFAQKLKDKKSVAIAKRWEAATSALLEENMKVEPELNCQNVRLINQTRANLRNQLKRNLTAALKAL